MCSYSIGDPIEVGQISRENHHCSFLANPVERHDKLGKLPIFNSFQIGILDCNSLVKSSVVHLPGNAQMVEICRRTKRFRN